MEGYSHCWIIYIFHRNTDLQDLWRPDDRGLKAKVQVPKLNGKRVGVFATRTPHRPNPIGQSLATAAGHMPILGLLTVTFACAQLCPSPSNQYAELLLHVSGFNLELWSVHTERQSL